MSPKVGWYGKYSDALYIRLSTLNGYDGMHNPRARGKGDNVTLLKKTILKATKVRTFASLERIAVTISTESIIFALFAFTALPQAARCSTCTDQFIKDFNQYVNSRATSSGLQINSLNLNERIREPTNKKTQPWRLAHSQRSHVPVLLIIYYDHYPIIVTV